MPWSPGMGTSQGTRLLGSWPSQVTITGMRLVQGCLAA